MGYFQYMGHSICALEPFAVSDLHQLQTVPITNLTEIIFLFLLLQFNIFNFKIFDSYRDIKPDNLLLDSKVYTNLSSVFYSLHSDPSMGCRGRRITEFY